MKKDWYPNALNDLKNYNPFESDYITIGKFQAKEYNYDKIITALVPLEILPLLKGDSINFNIDTSGPHSMPPDEKHEFIPRFWIWTSLNDTELEPLVISWESSNYSTFWPDQGFLMSYGLIPRFIPKSQKVHWDEPQVPKHDVIIMKPLTHFDWGNAPETYIKVQKDFVCDYSTLRKKAIVQIYWKALLIEEDDDELESLLKDKEYRKFEFEDRVIELSRHIDKYKYHIEITGYRILCRPGNSPVSADRWEYDSLEWPGYEKPITKDIAMRSRPWNYVYVKDSVLSKFEGQEGFLVYPESGFVDYPPQWSVAWCKRIGRNLIQIELKKLYEGTIPEIIKHYNQYAVEPPTDGLEEKNIAQLSKELVESFLKLGECLARFISSLNTNQVECSDLINLSREKIDSLGWWSFEIIEPIARHVPENLNKQQFLDRCVDFDKLLCENLNEKKLWTLLVQLGTPDTEIGNFRSLSLLRLLLEVVIISNSSGLDIQEHFKEIYNRIDKDNMNQKMDVLFALNHLRQLASHKIGSKYNTRFNEAFEKFGIETELSKPGFYNIIFLVYEKLIKCINDISDVIHCYLQ